MGKRGKLKAIVTIVLMIALMVVGVSDSAGSVPGMDTDLGDSDASFWGEAAGDGSGGTVAGSGDVNGDGYDDILIGVRYNDEGGKWAGQTYLISSQEFDTDGDGAGEEPESPSLGLVGALMPILIAALIARKRRMKKRYNGKGGSDCGNACFQL